MRFKNKALEKIEQELFKEINELKDKYLEQVDIILSLLQKFIIYHSSQDFNVSSETI